MAAERELPRVFFDRQDEGDDADFYAMPRLVVHIDAETIAALTQAYRELLPKRGAILDLMSSWVSHLPEEAEFTRVAGLGMNAFELEQNSRLTEHVVQDLNQQPELPYDTASFDAVVNAVSIQYLTRPVEVFRSCARVLRPGGLHIIALSHRCFPTKAIRACMCCRRSSGSKSCKRISAARGAMRQRSCSIVLRRTQIRYGSSWRGVRPTRGGNASRTAEKTSGRAGDDARETASLLFGAKRERQSK